MPSPILENNKMFSVNDLVFAKIKGYCYWPARITDIDSETYKNTIKYKVLFFGTNEMGVVGKTNICSFKDNILKFPVETVPKKHQDLYKKTILEVIKISNDKKLSQKNSPKVNQMSITPNTKILKSTFKPNLPNVKKESVGIQTDVIVHLPMSKNLQRNDVFTNTDDKAAITLSVLEGGWITDDVICACYELISSTLHNINAKVVLMSPVITLGIKCLGNYDNFLDYDKLTEATHIIFPISDSVEITEDSIPNTRPNQDFSSGTHWSLLVFVKNLSTFFYYDSLVTYNLSHAKKVAAKISILFGSNHCLPINVANVPSQPNTKDWGVYLILFTEKVVQGISSGALHSQQSFMSQFLSDISLFELLTKRAQLALIFHTYTNAFHDMKSLACMVTTPMEADERIEVCIQCLSPLIQHNTEKNNWKTAKNTGNTCKTNNVTEFRLECSNRFTALEEEKIPRQNSSTETLNISYPLKDKYQSTKNTHKPGCNINKTPLQKDELIIMADSHGKELSYLVQQRSSHNVLAFVHPGASFSEVTHEVDKLGENLKKNDHLLIIAGTNDVEKCSVGRLTKDIFKTLSNLNHTNVIVATLPVRHDKPDLDLKVAQINAEIERFVLNSKRMKLLRLHVLPRHLFTKHGLHLNRRGKARVATTIAQLLTLEKRNSLEYTPNRSPCSSTSLPSSSLPSKGINVIEANMWDIAEEFKNDSTVALAHTISDDYQHPRHMSAGVAVFFREKFGRPQVSDLVTENLACQKVSNGPFVYSLITKPTYNAKPTVAEYNAAFHEFQEDFKLKGLKRLVCSAMGCVRDLIDPKHFVRNIFNFHQATGVPVHIVSHNQHGRRTLWKGLSHDDFVNMLRSLIASQQPETDELPSQNEVPGGVAAMSPVAGTAQHSSTTSGSNFQPDIIEHSESIENHCSVNISEEVSVPVEENSCVESSCVDSVMQKESLNDSLLASFNKKNI